MGLMMLLRPSSSGTFCTRMGDVTKMISSESSNPRACRGASVSRHAACRLVTSESPDPGSEERGARRRRDASHGTELWRVSAHLGREEVVAEAPDVGEAFDFIRSEGIERGAALQHCWVFGLLRRRAAACEGARRQGGRGAA